MSSFKSRGSFKENVKRTIRSLCELWPLIPAILVTYLNIDWVVTPYLIKRGVPLSELLPVEYILSTLELIFWFWFWSWVWNLFIKALIHTRIGQEDILLAKNFWETLKEKGVFACAKDFLFKMIDGALDEKNLIIRFIKWGGVFSLILIGASPESGSRVIGIIFCKMFRWKNGFYPLVLGNLIHITYIVLGWKYFGIFRMIMFLMTIAILSYVFKRVFIKKQPRT